MARNYDLLLQVLKKWPVDKKKSSRCYGNYLRDLARRAFPSGNMFQGGEVENYKMLKSLLRLADNKYGQSYPYQKPYGASGFKCDELNRYLSDESVDKYFIREKSVL